MPILRYFPFAIVSLIPLPSFPPFALYAVSPRKNQGRIQYFI